MKTPKTSAVLSIFIFALVFLSSPLPSLAQEANEITQYLTEKGIAFFRQGRKRQAIHEFSKALLVDPENKTAKKYLKKMGFDRGIYGELNSPIDQILELNEERNFLNSQVSELEQSNSEKNRVNEELAAEKERICRAFWEKKDEANTLQIAKNVLQSDLAQKDQLIEALHNGYSDKEKEIEDLNKSIESYEGDLRKQEKILRIKNRDIEDLRSDLKYIEARLIKDELEYREKEAGLKSVSSEQAAEFEAFNEQLFNIKSQLAQKGALLDAKDKELNDIGRRLDEISQEAAARADEIEDNLAATDETVDKIKDQASQRVHNKEQEIRSLRESLAQKQAELDDLMKQLDSASGDLGKIKQQWQRINGAGASSKDNAEILELLKKRDHCIAELKARLAQVTTKLNALLREHPSEDTAEIGNLRKEIADLNQLLSDREKTLQESQGNIGLLEERLRDVQEQLTLLNQIVGEREEKIKELQEQLENTPSMPSTP